MSLPPGFLDELRTRVSLSAIIGRKVTWDLRKSNMAKGDWWSPCPFHQEKSASFHVDDRKGFYYCFGCQAKGDVLTFLKESENIGFMEAVALLAQEAGMQMPERDARAAEKADRRSQLAEVMEEGFKWFRLQLKTAPAAAARAYLARRGLPEEAQARWEIGFAPDNRQALFHALSQKGIAPELIIASGLCAKPEDGGAPYDRFRDRIIFPIRDGRGRAMSLGGRAMAADARAKYLNGPETELFDKGRNLYNLARAREASGKGATVILAEGYMDVIALSEAGFTGAVAPLGTAVTEDQLRLLWRIADEPVVALDGDKAGLRAALRVIDLALPLLEAGKALRFALMPEGEDPDDLIRAKGAAAMQEVLDGAQPMVRLLWTRETEGKVFDSPERKAALDKALRAHLKRITDPSIRSHYGEDIKELRWELFRTGRKPQRRADGGSFTPGRRTGGGFSGRGALALKYGDPSAPPSASLKNSALGQAEEVNAVGDGLREALILATLLRFPALVAKFELGLERIEFHHGDHERLRNLLLTHYHEADPAALIAADSPDALDRLRANPHLRVTPALQPRADEEFAAACVEEALAWLQADRAHRIELSEAVEDLEHLADEGLTWRLSRAAQARHDAKKGPQEQKAESVIAPNGVELDREELNRQRKLFDSIDFSRGGKPRPE